MCLLVVAHRASDEWPLIVAANRDEFHGRPTREAHRWPDRPSILGGRDLQAGGTWLAVSENGRFAAVTNYRDAAKPQRGLRSRGALVTGFLESELAPGEFVDDIDGDRYAGFNLLAADRDSLAYASNRGGGRRVLDPGVYGLANATLDTPWFKVTRAKHGLSALLESGRVNESELMRLLADRERARVGDVDTSEFSFDTAHALSAPFIVMPDYGTRCSTVLLRGPDGRGRFAERQFDAGGRQTGSASFKLGAYDA